MRRNVTGPDGRTWEVRRRWLPRLRTQRLRERFRRRTRGEGRAANSGDLALEAAGALGDNVLGVIMALVGTILVLVFVLPLLLSFVDLLLLVLIGGLGLAGRLLGFRPWAVDAIASNGAELEWRVHGWRASRERVDQVANLIVAGLNLPGPDA